MSNSYYLGVTWVITFPDETSLSITYDHTSDGNIYTDLGMGVATTLTEHVIGYYAESILKLRVLRDIAMDGTQLSCSSSRLDNAAISVPVNSKSES
jgi:hypothetical protein